MEPSWLETYYTALEFIYWEPQHLGRKKNPEARLDSLKEVSKRLRGLEVTLNHNIDQFLRLAPSGFRNDLFASVFAKDFRHSFHMHGREVDQDFELAGVMQPDLVFESEAEVVSIEMKINAKSSVAQVLKYGLLGLAIELSHKEPRQHHLLMLSRAPFDSLWKERFRDLAELQSALSGADLAAFLRTRPLRFRPHLQAFTRVVQELQISWLSYSGLASFLRGASPPEHDGTAGAEVYRKLITGMVGELSLRQLET